MKKLQNTTEILFEAGFSVDRRGKRVLVREEGIENYIWSEDGVTDVDMRLLGLNEWDQEHIEKFFGRGIRSNATLI